jgi:hypothetical protein
LPSGKRWFKLNLTGHPAGTNIAAGSFNAAHCYLVGGLAAHNNRSQIVRNPLIVGGFDHPFWIEKSHQEQRKPHQYG